MTSPRMKREFDSGIEMPNQHRVSFGSKGSMVETWIIYDDNKDSQSLQESDTADQQTPRFVSSNSSKSASPPPAAAPLKPALHYHHHHHQQQQPHEYYHQHQLHHNPLQHHHHHQQQALHAPHHQQQQLSTKVKADTRVTFGAPPQGASRSPPRLLQSSSSPLSSLSSSLSHDHHLHQQQQQQITGKPRLNSDTDAMCAYAAFQRRPVKRSQSLESRDNPFVPGGELSIDTDDILKRATIVRDRFILDEEEKKKKAAAEEEAQRKKKQAAAPGGDASLISNAAVEGVTENGKVEEVPLEAESAKTAENEAPEVPVSPQASQDDGRPDTTGTPATETREAVAVKEKEKKKQKKCCTIM